MRRILDDQQLGRLHAVASAAGLSILVEVHNEEELERALGVGSKLIGVNNRDLDTFTTDLGVTERLAARAPKDVLLVAESGIRTRADVERAQKGGGRARSWWGDR